MRVSGLATLGVVLLSFAPCFAPRAAAQDAPKLDPSSAPRAFVINGSVALPDGSPARRAIVRITSRQGFTREMPANDQGRFEFRDMPPGFYRLTASDPADASLVSEPAETDTSRTATDYVSVTVFLRRGGVGGPGGAEKARAVSVTEAAQKVPKEARKAYARGLKLKEGGKLDEAFESFSRAIEIYPDYFQALSERGDLYVARRRLAEAAADFDRALKVDPHHGHALRGAGYCKLERKEFAAAAADFERAITADPDNFNAHLLYGIANVELDRRDAARAALRQALKLSPDGAARAHIYLANLYARERAFNEAADELHAYLAINPAAPDADRLRQAEAQWRGRALAPKQ
jgi:tetratricopeptide (TPR) repeat protein